MAPPASSIHPHRQPSSPVGRVHKPWKTHPESFDPDSFPPADIYEAAGFKPQDRPSALLHNANCPPAANSAPARTQIFTRSA